MKIDVPERLTETFLILLDKAQSEIPETTDLSEEETDCIEWVRELLHKSGFKPTDRK